MGMDVIGMTNMRAARLAREAEICFSTIALVTDYDAWHEEIEPVSVPEVMANLKASIESARAGIMSSLSNIPEKRECACATALSSALMTDNNSISHESREKLSLLINKYLN